MSANAKFYGAPISPFSMRVHMQVAAKGLAIPMVEAPDGVHSPAYAAIAPFGKIPLLELDGVRLPESEVICELLDDLYPDPPLRPADPVMRAKMRLVSRVLDTYVMNPMLPVFAHLNPKTRDDAVVKTALDAVAQGLQWLDKIIAPGPYAVGETLTLADCAGVPILLFVERFPPLFGRKDALSSNSNVLRYWQAIAKDRHAAETIAMMREAFGKH